MNSELAVEERLRRLESQVRRARMWSVGTTVALGAVMLASMQAQRAKELVLDRVSAREFHVVDESGTERGVLGLDGRRGREESAVSLSLWGPSGGGNQVLLLAGSSSAELRLRDGTRSEALSCVGKDGAAFHASALARSASPIYLPVASLLAKAGEGALELLERKSDDESSGVTTIHPSGSKLRITPEAGVVRSKE